MEIGNLPPLINLFFSISYFLIFLFFLFKSFYFLLSLFDGNGLC